MLKSATSNAKGRFLIPTLIKSYDADPNTTFTDRHTPLTYAIYYKNFYTARTLIDAGSTVAVEKLFDFYPKFNSDETNELNKLIEYMQKKNNTNRVANPSAKLTSSKNENKGI
jgi:hypothetical protein